MDANSEHPSSTEFSRREKPALAIRRKYLWLIFFSALLGTPVSIILSALVFRGCSDRWAGTEAAGALLNIGSLVGGFSLARIILRKKRNAGLWETLGLGVILSLCLSVFHVLVMMGLILYSIFHYGMGC